MKWNKIIVAIVVYMVMNSLAYSKGQDITVERSIKLGKIAQSGKSRVEVVKPKDGFILKVRGRKNGIVKIEVEDISDLNGFKVVEIIPEEEWLKLDEKGEGIFKIGAKIIIPGFIAPGRHKSKIRARIAYKSDI